MSFKPLYRGAEERWSQVGADVLHESDLGETDGRVPRHPDMDSQAVAHLQQDAQRRYQTFVDGVDEQ